MTKEEGITTLSDEQLEAMLHRAARSGAVEALKSVGLHDENAGPDIREVRTLLAAWRDTKRAAWSQFVKLATTAVLGAMAAGFWLYGGNR
jgi:hypothetical protein